MSANSTLENTTERGALSSKGSFPDRRLFLTGLVASAVCARDLFSAEQDRPVGDPKDDRRGDDRDQQPERPAKERIPQVALVDLMTAEGQRKYLGQKIQVSGTSEYDIEGTMVVPIPGAGVMTVHSYRISDASPSGSEKRGVAPAFLMARTSNRIPEGSVILQGRLQRDHLARDGKGSVVLEDLKLITRARNGKPDQS